MHAGLLSDSVVTTRLKPPEEQRSASQDPLQPHTHLQPVGGQRAGGVLGAIPALSVRALRLRDRGAWFESFVYTCA